MRAALLLLVPALLIAAPSPNWMPVPAKAVFGEGRLAITQHFRVAITGKDEPRVLHGTERLIARIEKQTGMPLDEKLLRQASEATLVIRSETAGDRVQNVNEDESYTLIITPEQARLSAPNPLGILHGIETFLQLVSTDANGFSVPVVSIEDRPRFPWRGLLIDASRHWMPVDVIERNIDGLAAVKMNVLHWHLSDDQGFRVESKRYPKLQEFGSDGHYYTQAQIREVVAYARDRGVRVVPEFDIPGHSQSWFPGYPKLASAPGPFDLFTQFSGYTPPMNPTSEYVYRFLDGFLGEMARLFPDEYMHIGGDEVGGKAWDTNPEIRAFMRRKKIKDDHALQAYFNRRILAILKKHHKKMEGWDEILQPELPKNVVIQSWRGQKSLADAVKQGYQGILSSGYYLDHIRPASYHYLIDPIANETGDLTPEQQKRILGGEACMWGEYVDPETIDSRIWPRTAAIAERLWSPSDVKDVPDMYRRLEALGHWLDTVGLTHNSNYLPMLRRLAGSAPVEPLEVLADVCEPVKNYSRGREIQYTTFTPLNRLVDAVRPESMAAHDFAALVDRGADPAVLRPWLTLWRDNDAKLEPVIAQSFLLAGTVSLSQDLSTLGSIGLQALDYRASGKPAPREWVQQQLAVIQNAKKPRVEVLLMIADPIAKLVSAAGATQ